MSFFVNKFRSSESGTLTITGAGWPLMKKIVIKFECYINLTGSAPWRRVSRNNPWLTLDRVMIRNVFNIKLIIGELTQTGWLNVYSIFALLFYIYLSSPAKQGWRLLDLVLLWLGIPVHVQFAEQCDPATDPIFKGQHHVNPRVIFFKLLSLVGST